MANDAMLIGEGWLSEHFFSSNATSESYYAAVVRRHREWKSSDEAGHPSARARFRAARSRLVDGFNDLARLTSELEPSNGDDAQWPQGADTAATLRETNYDALIDALGGDAGFRELEQDGPVRWLRQAGVDAAELAIIEATPVDTIDDLLRKDAPTLVEPYVPEDDESHPVTSASRLLSRVFQYERVPFAMVLAGRWVLVTDRDRWPEGRYLAIDLQLVLERNNQKQAAELDQATAALVFESFASTGLDNNGTPWWSEVIELSKRHSVGVSDDLREGVRLSIEIIANEVVARRRAQGLPPLPQAEAQPLAVEALRYLYRILFLLYAEASPELEVVPVGTPEYGEGYGIDRLRDLTIVRLDSDRAQHTTHLYQSLDVLFRLIDQGHGEHLDEEAVEDLREGVTFHSLRADLFAPRAISRISEVQLGDAALQRVLRHLLLSKEQRGRDRGFISYADLGINQLGAVYEGLMSYSGFFAEDDLYEVAKGGDGSKGSWVVPTSRADHLSDADFVMTDNPITGAREKVVHRRGTFVFRLSGRARQQSASYYTPEVLTRFVVSQALAELLDQDDTITTADEILQLTVCEPALGSGAFAIEATRQLAEEYLTRKQAELGRQIEPEDYPRELQKVKAQIALHQVYGVDLNATAVELAEISLWLDTMSKGLDAPWFGLHLRRGNSLIGARHALYRRDQLAKRGWLNLEPTAVPTTTLQQDLNDFRLASATSGQVFHFLLPADGWAAAADAKDIKTLAPEGAKSLREWRKRVQRALTKQQIDRLVNLSMRVEALWQFVVRRLEIAESEVRRDIEVWGSDRAELAERHDAVTREEIERKLHDPEGAYQRLRLVMNAWSALWFWPVPLDEELKRGTAVAPPELDAWIDALEALLGKHFEAKQRVADAGQTTLSVPTTWLGLGDAEQLDLDLSGAAPVAETVSDFPWLATVREVADAQGFFHWELDFAALFAQRGGFDLQVGNPPWVRPRTDVEALYAEGDPWWQLNPKATQADKAHRRELVMTYSGIAELVVGGVADVLATSAFVGSPIEYSPTAGLQPDLYRAFMVTTWRHVGRSGIVSLIHPESHFTDVKAGNLRRETYQRLRRHWHFKNEIMLFKENDDKMDYGIHVYGNPGRVDFLNALFLYHPETLEASLVHNGDGQEPGIKNDEGNWDLRPHGKRITRVTPDVLESWQRFTDGETSDPLTATMVYSTGATLQGIIEKLSSQPRLANLGLSWSRGWDESIDRRAGRFDVDWGPAESWDDVILQGVHMHVANPFFKSPNKTMKHNQDWTPVDLETLAANAKPITSYKPIHDGSYDSNFTQWNGYSARDFFRFGWRRMAANTGERTLIGTVLPPGSAHVHPVYAAGSPELSMEEILEICGVMASLVSDFQIRVVPKSDIHFSTLERIAIRVEPSLSTSLVWRSARLISLTSAYSGLVPMLDSTESWAIKPWWCAPQNLSTSVNDNWSPAFPLRLDAERRQALLEIDAIVALSLGLTADELCTIYRTQFPVLRGYDQHKYVFDANGRLVPTGLIAEWRKRGDALTDEERHVPNAAGNPTQYVLPFRTLDREAEMREAYAYFERKLAERG